jgi:hypothetical protein
MSVSLIPSGSSVFATLTQTPATIKAATTTETTHIQPLIELITHVIGSEVPLSAHSEDSPGLDDVVAALEDLLSHHTNWGVLTLNIGQRQIIGRVKESLEALAESEDHTWRETLGGNKATLEEGIQTLTQLHREAIGVIPRAKQIVEEALQKANEQIRELIAAQFTESAPLQTLLSYLDGEDAIGQIREWRRANSEALSKILFGKETAELSDQETEEVTAFRDSLTSLTHQEPAASAAAVATEDPAQTATSIAAFRSLVEKAYSRQSGSTKKVELVVKQVLSEASKRFAELKGQATDLLKSVFNDVPQTVKDLQKALETISKADHSSVAKRKSLQKQLSTAFEPFVILARATSEEDPRRVSSNGSASSASSAHVNYNYIAYKIFKCQFFGVEKESDISAADGAEFDRFINENFRPLFQYMKNIHEVGHEFNPTTISQCLSELNRLIEKRSGMVAKLRTEFDSRVERELTTAPACFRAALHAVIALKENSSVEKRRPVHESLQQALAHMRQASVKKPHDFEEKAQIVSGFIANLGETHYQLTNAKIAEITEILLGWTKSIQGAAFQALDSTFVAVADERSGMLPALLQSVFGNLSVELSKDAPKALLAVHKAAVAYQANKALKSQLLVAIQAALPSDLHISTKDILRQFPHDTHAEDDDAVAAPDFDFDFDRWLQEITKIKEGAQGVIPRAMDALGDQLGGMVQKLFGPAFELFGTTTPGSESTTEPKPNFFTKAISLIEFSAHDNIKNIVLISLKSIKTWVEKNQLLPKRTDDNSLLVQVLEKAIAIVEKLDPKNKGQRDQAVAELKDLYSQYHFMIDAVIALPSFDSIQENDLALKLRVALQTRELDGKVQTIKEHLDGVDTEETLISHIQDSKDKATVKALLQTFLTGTPTPSECTQLDGLLRKHFDLKSIRQAAKEIKGLLTPATPQSQEITALSLSAINERNAELCKRLSQTSTFYLLYQFVGLFSDNYKTLETDHTKILEQSADDADYLQKLGEIDFETKRATLFPELTKDLSNDLEVRKNEFIERLKNSLHQMNPFVRGLLEPSLPFLYSIFNSAMSPLITKIFDMITQLISGKHLKNGDALDVTLIEKITGFLNEISTIYEKMDGHLSGTTVREFLLDEIKEGQVKIDGKKLVAKQLFNQISSKIIDILFSEFSISPYLKKYSASAIKQMHRIQPGIQGIIITAILGVFCILIESINLMLIPLEMVLITCLKFGVKEGLKFSNIYKQLIEKPFEELRKKTGIYHTIKGPIAKFLTTIDPETPSAPLPGVKDQEKAAHAFAELYASLETAVTYFTQGTSRDEVRRIVSARKSDPNFIAIKIAEFQKSLFAKNVVPLILAAYNQYSSKSFLQGRVLPLGLESIDTALCGLGGITTRLEENAMRRVNDEHDSTIREKSPKVLSGLFHVVIHQALSDLGSKHQEETQTFITSIKKLFENLKLSENFDQLEKLAQVKEIDRLRILLRNLIVDLEGQLDSFLNNSAVSKSTKSIVKAQISQLIHMINEDLAVNIAKKVEAIKLEYEKAFFQDHLASLNDQSKALIEQADIIKSKIETEEKSDELLAKYSTAIQLLDATIRSFGKDYKVGDDHIPLSDTLIRLLSQYEKFKKSAEAKHKELSAYRNQDILKSQLPDLQVKIDTLFSTDSRTRKEDAEEIVAILAHFLTLPHYEEIKSLLLHLHKITDEATLQSKKALFETFISEVKEKTLLNTNLTTPDHRAILTSSEKLDDVPNDSTIIGSIKALVDRSGALNPTKIINIEIIEHSPIFKWAEQAIISYIQSELEKYKVFFGSDEIVEGLTIKALLPAAYAKLIKA